MQDSVGSFEFGGLLIGGLGGYRVKVPVFAVAVPGRRSVLRGAPGKGRGRTYRPGPLGIGGQLASFPGTISLCFEKGNRDYRMVVCSVGSSLVGARAIWMAFPPDKSFRTPEVVLGVTAPFFKGCKLNDADFCAINAVGCDFA
jgi:hypothetical protein